MKVVSANSDMEQTDPGLWVNRIGVRGQETVEGGWCERC